MGLPQGIRGLLCAALAITGGCDAEADATVLVELTTDLSPDLQFEVVRTRLAVDRRTDVVDMGLVDERAVSGDASFITATRVAEFGGVAFGEYRVIVELLQGGGVVARVVERASIQGNLGIAVTISRLCRGVSCPTGGVPSTATSCVGGTCVEPSCTTGREPSCPPRECSVDDDCVGGPACAVPTCVDGLCLRSIDPFACRAGERCLVDEGCVANRPCIPQSELCNGLDDDCDEMVDEGFDLDTDADHCGACGIRCQSINGNATCEGGRCLVSCDSGFGDCNSVADDGCEASLSRTETCGGCSVQCPSDFVCVVEDGFRCAVNCSSGLTLCDSSCVDVSSDARHCGACDNDCSLSNATAVCQGGGCVVGTCASGFADCNGFAADGCETPLNTSSNCGACGVGCSPPSGTGSCATGTCEIVSCPTGRDDCDGNPANGCENTLNSTSHCGRCRRSCRFSNASATCSSGMCALASCAPEWEDCDANPANGCEVNGPCP